MAEIRSRLKVIGDVLQSEAEQALIQTATDVVEIAKQLAPVDTGSLRASYMFSLEEPDRVIVGSLANIINPKTKQPATEYAAFVEYGTENSPAQPHFIEAFIKASNIFRVRLTEILNKRL